MAAVMMLSPTMAYADTSPNVRAEAQDTDSGEEDPDSGSPDTDKKKTKKKSTSSGEETDKEEDSENGTVTDTETGGESADPENGGSVPADSSGSQTESGGTEGTGSVPESGTETTDSGEHGGSGDKDPAPGENTGTESGQEGSGNDGGGQTKPAEDSGTETTDSGTEDPDSGTEIPDSGTESTDSRPDTEDKPGTDSQKDADSPQDTAKQNTDSEPQENVKEDPEQQPAEETVSGDSASDGNTGYTAPSSGNPDVVIRSGTAAPTSRIRTGSATSSTSIYGMKRFIRIKEIRKTVKKDTSIYTGRKEDSQTAVAKLQKGATVRFIKNVDATWAFVETKDGKNVIARGYILQEVLENAQNGNEEDRTLVEVLKKMPENEAFYFTNTTTYSDLVRSARVSAARQEIVNYSMQFLGNPYVWGGESLTDGCDCSGFTQQIYRYFGIEIPRVSYEQCYAGERITLDEALPGDLIFYAKEGTVYHVLMCTENNGNGNVKAINAASSTLGIIISDVDTSKVAWACRFIADDYTSTQASDLQEAGKRAYEGDTQSQEDVIKALATASEKAWDEYGFSRSVLIAQAIQESGFCAFAGAANGGIQPEDNNILGMNEDLMNEKWVSPWTGKAVSRNVPQWDGTKDVYGSESMRAYEDIESCMEDYAAFKTGLHPEIADEPDIDTVIDVGLAGYATDPTYQESIRSLIDRYDLTRYDVDVVDPEHPTDPTLYTQEELELIWALVAQEDDSGYEGALAVISSVMNRVDADYGGYGKTALAQLTADGQYCYSEKVSDPSYYRARLNGNVSDSVKQAVSDCLTGGVRNHDYLNFRSTDTTGSSKQIGSNWYF